jgi:hypothetical protein
MINANQRKVMVVYFNIFLPTKKLEWQNYCILIKLIVELLNYYHF